jgi:hypothetical protein
MQINHKLLLGGAVALGAAGSAHAETMTVSVTLPRLTVAEYHKPYVALWIEKEGAPAKTLSVWYDMGKRNNAGTKWLRDMRLWWRAGGRALTMPADGVSGATKGPGAQSVTFNTPLPAGNYRLVVEAAREAGGSEVVRVPFTVAANGAARGSASGKAELGAVSLTVKK